MDHIILTSKRPSTKLIEAFSKLSSATVYEAGGQKGAIASCIKPVFPDFKVCGPAFTVMVPAGDNIMVHKAINEAAPGDVLVVNTGGFTEAGFWGEVMAVAAQARGIKGLVTDGAVRDTLQIKELDFPVFSAGVCIKGTQKDELGFIGYPVNIAGVIVKSDDIILADADGIVVVDPARAEDVLSKSQERDAKEARQFEKLKQGDSTLEMYDFDSKLKLMGLSI